MTDKMKTVCVGRFLIDLPADARVSIGRGYAGGYEISTTADETDEQFAARLRLAEAELKELPNRDGRPSLESSKELIIGKAHGKLLVHNRQRTKVPEGDRMTMSETVSVRSLLRLPGVSITANVDWIDPDEVGDLERLLAQLMPLEEMQIPRQPGFCFDRAFVKDPYDHLGTEGVVLFAGLPGHSDVNIVFSSMSGTSAAPGLLERNTRASEREPMLMRLAFSTLRQAARAINGLEGEELVLRVREPNLTTGYSFQWEMPGKQKDIYAPLLTLELDSGTNPVTGGKPVQSTLSEGALFELWERIANSIRLRPTQDVQAAIAEPVTTPLGTTAFSGEACPHTGWWQCCDGGSGIGVLGGQRQYLRGGQQMPQALLLPAQTLWERLRGVQPSFESSSPSLWKLADKRATARVPPSSMLAHATTLSEADNAPAAAPLHGVAQTLIGSEAKTGTPCPASGWWRCDDSHALDGTRWFAAGSLLPPATFRAPLSLRGSAHPEIIHRRSAWQLVRLAHGAQDNVDSGPGPRHG
ncbi:T6SS immunity protein Tli4 family protein [Massilia sp. H6]|uniref:T6SS immunity protein Tli4 family protein n=1 Tax=Massilia sp. H6 TaxID=2970464 RepID=UPI0021686AB2|nr:T6SS immunity protein Tli4 family protein [Massilia sp. H6]UVW26981.1 T6SS immunity protein Tli4 family protein [Massilia sp. H6]